MRSGVTVSSSSALEWAVTCDDLTCLFRSVTVTRLRSFLIQTGQGGSSDRNRGWVLHCHGHTFTKLGPGRSKARLDC